MLWLLAVFITSQRLGVVFAESQFSTGTISPSARDERRDDEGRSHAHVDGECYKQVCDENPKVYCNGSCKLRCEKETTRSLEGDSPETVARDVRKACGRKCCHVKRYRHCSLVHYRCSRLKRND